jgi:hypothetical protein
VSRGNHIAQSAHTCAPKTAITDLSGSERSGKILRVSRDVLHHTIGFSPLILISGVPPKFSAITHR